MSVRNVKRPLILKRMIIKPSGSLNKTPTNTDLKNINKLIKLSTIPLYREDVIFVSKGEPFITGEYQKLSIVNKLNNLTNNCQTKATCVTLHGEKVEKTSDNLVKLIGQEAYNTLFYALCSVINQEYKIKAILSLLTVEEIKPDLTNIKIASMGTNEKSCQTNETRLEKMKRNRRRTRKVLVPYVVKPEEVRPKKITVNPYAKCFINMDSLKCDELINNDKNILSTDIIYRTEVTGPDLNFKKVVTSTLEEAKTTLPPDTPTVDSNLPDLGYLHDENSNESAKTFSSIHTFKTTSDLLINPISIVDNVDKHTIRPTGPSPIMLMDGTMVQVPFKPEDVFHIATKENLQVLDETNRKKLLFHQMQIDYKHCLSLRDEDGNLPIHLAVINEDLELLKRNCVVLKIRNQTVDIPADNGLTALKLSLFRDSGACTVALLQHGADPFLADTEHGTSAHIAAELKSDQLSLVLNHCRLHARDIIMQHAEELQTPGWEDHSDEELAAIVLHHISSLFDKPGYTPLMLSSKLGHYENVRLLVESAPRTVNLAMPTCGNTALFLAVAAASCASAESGNKSKVVDHFRKTIEILLEAGADPSIDNHFGSNVNLLLQEFNCAELSMLVANKVTCIKYFNGDEEYTRNFDKYILINDGERVSLQEITKSDKSVSKKGKKGIAKATGNDNESRKSLEMIHEDVAEQDSNKPVITKNILLTKAPLAVNQKCKSKDAKNTVNSKDFVIKPCVKSDAKIDAVSTVKKVIWYPLKRKKEVPKANAKKSKFTG